MNYSIIEQAQQRWRKYRHKGSDEFNVRIHWWESSLCGSGNTKEPMYNKGSDNNEVCRHGVPLRGENGAHDAI